MRCEEFEAALQQQADGCLNDHDEAALRKHAHGCPACQELEDGFRLVVQGFAATRLPVPPPALSQRIIQAATAVGPVEKQRALWWRGPAPRLAAAAAVLITVGW